MTTNFKQTEFNCKCGCEMPPQIKLNIQKVANQLEVIRKAVNKPITITSGYRCPKRNNICFGASKSKHLEGIAVDIKIKGLKAREIYNLLENLIIKGEILQGGLGRYPTWVHYDIRKTKARW